MKRYNFLPVKLTEMKKKRERIQNWQKLEEISTVIYSGKA